MAMKAGDELDALVAEHVMGFRGREMIKQHGHSEWHIAFREKPAKSPWYYMSSYGVFVTQAGEKLRYGTPWEPYEPPHYSERLTDGWQVFEKLGTGWVVGQNHENGGKPWWCAGGSVDAIEVGDDTPMLAICKAALLAVLSI